MSKSDKPASTSSFGQTLAELERITSILESDDADLDEAITYFEQGSELALRLQKQLTEAEQKIKKIKAQFDAPLASAPNASEVE